MKLLTFSLKKSDNIQYLNITSGITWLRYKLSDTKVQVYLERIR